MPSAVVFSDDFNIMPLTQIVCAHFVRQKWNSEFLNVCNNIDEEAIDATDREMTLVDWREKYALDTYAYLENEGLPKFFRTMLKKSVFSLYQAYHKMLWWVENYEVVEINLSQISEIHMGNYFLIFEDFNELICMRHILNNLNFTLKQRFIISCLYCFESESAALWQEIKRTYARPYSVVSAHQLVKLRVCSLEGVLHVLAQELHIENNFWVYYFKKSVRQVLGHATVFFWNKLSEDQKLTIMNQYKFFKLLDCDVVYGKKITLFLYMQLSNDRKLDLLNWMVNHDNLNIWLVLSYYWYIKKIRAELLEFVNIKQDEILNKLTNTISIRIQLLKLPTDIDVFEALWYKLSPARKYSLEECMYVIEAFVQEKSFYALGLIVKSLSFELKRNFLLHEWHGMNCIVILSKAEEFELLQTYFSLFLFKQDPHTQIVSLEKDGCALLEQLVGSEGFQTTCREALVKEKDVILEIIESLQIIVPILDNLCNMACHKVFTL